MYAYIVKRILMLLPTLISAAILIFCCSGWSRAISACKFGGEGAYTTQQTGCRTVWADDPL